MTSTTGASPSPAINTTIPTSTILCSTTVPMVSGHSLSADDEEPNNGAINGGSPLPSSVCESRIPPSVSLSHIVSVVTSPTSTSQLLSSVETDEKPLELALEEPTTSEEHFQNSTRCHQPRNKRKNFKPRNIVYHFSDSEYDDDGSDGEEYDGDSLEHSRSSSTMRSPECRISPHFVPINVQGCGEAAAQPLDLSSDTSTSRWRMNAKSPKSDIFLQSTIYNPVNLSVRCPSNELEEGIDQDPVLVCQQTPVIDLSCGGRESTSSHMQRRNSEPWGSESGTEDQDRNDCDSPPRRLPQNISSFRGAEVESHHSSADGGTMKDYAENTMKELLGMYGLNDGSDTMPNHLSVQNYNLGKIPELLTSTQSSCPSSVCSYSQEASGLHLLHQQREMDAFAEARRNHQPLSKDPLSHYVESQWLPSAEPNNIPNLSQPLPRSGEAVFETLRAKMLNNLPRLGQLASNNIIPNPQVTLPQNMATIFTIAALSSKLPSLHASENASKAPTICTSAGSPHFSSSSTIMGSLCSTPSPVVSSSPLSNAVSTTSSTYRLDHNQKLGPVDYTRYVKRFSNATECGGSYCKDLNYREHFHCLDCNSRVFVKKEEMIRHFKWHKKRDDSLQHGFMRYSPMDDCSDRFCNCSHNRKQTHYHCLKESCDKVYISTSDVQMHANYHRKDSAIIQEGFQRFRATENCATSACLFFGQRTTHFHCRRSGCSFTFKNKADMEKHKTYHIKDEQLNKDGFKKFMKHEHCSFENCRFSRVCNHIHCIRPGCTYVLHSSGQLYSHKRKHERRDTELAYRKFKLAQSMMKSLSESGGLSQAYLPEPPSSGESSSSPAPGPLQLTSLPVSSQLNNSSFYRDDTSLNDCYMMNSEKTEQNYMPSLPEAKSSLFSKYIPHTANVKTLATSVSGVEASCSLPAEETSAVDLTTEHQKDSDDLWKMYLVRYGANETCLPQCEYLQKDHFHCSTDNCSMTFRAKDILGVKEHACNHEYQEQVTKSFYTVVEIDHNGACPLDCHFKAKEKHYHCKWENCHEVISSDDNPFRRLDHYKIHKYSRKLSAPKEHVSPGSNISATMENMFRRKRGRPPKNRVIEFPMGSSQLPQAIYTSFKLPKPGDLQHQAFPSPFGPFTSAYNAIFPPPVTMIATPSSMPQLIPVTGLAPTIFPPSNVFRIPSPTNEKQESISTMHSPPPIHQDILDQTQRQHQQQLIVQPEVHEGFYVFSKSMPCPDKLCAFHGQNHYHCTQPRCYYVTDRSDILLLHSKDFHDNIDILDGFVFFDRSVDCRLHGCHSNKINRHFHCVRANCNYSFVRYSTMTIHDQKHKEQENGNSIPVSPKKKRLLSVSETDVIAESSTSVIKSAAFTESSSQPKTTVVKAAGTFYPLSAFTTNQPTARASPSSHNAAAPAAPQHFFHAEERSNKDGGEKTEIAIHHSEEITEQPLSQLLQQPGPFSKSSYQGTEKHILYSLQQSCGRPFCKLKKVDHFHCNSCNQAFSRFSNLQGHMSKHIGAPSPTPVYPPGYLKLPSPSSSVDDEECGDVSDAEEFCPSNGPSSMSSAEKSEAASAAQRADQHVSSSQLFTWPSASGSPLQSSLKGSLVVGNANSMNSLNVNNESYYGSPQVDFTSLIDASDDPIKVMDLKRQFPGKLKDSAEIKKMKIAALRILKEEPIPEGYTRCRFNEDCGYPLCGYREHQTHFHCMRKDCGYSFCDKTRFVQHTARHERLDTLMGGDFQQYRSTVNCGRVECMYANTLGAMANNKSSHFHCRKCDFVCTDTNKVVAHRRQHAKMDSIYAAGFDKYTPFQSCNVEGCNHNQKQTHYHCLKCQYAVLGLSQMSSHKYRHMEC